MTYVQRHFGNAGDDFINFTDDTLGVTTRWDQRGRRRAAGPTPTAAVGAAAGTGATISSITGSDESGTITITGGTAPTTGILATITFAAGYTVAPYASILPKNAASASIQLYATTTLTTLVINCAVAPAASQTLAFDYTTIGGL
jgi:hypothetical protein